MKKTKPAAKRHKISAAVEIIHRTAKKDSSLMREIDIARINARVAQLIYDSRTDAGLTQQELANLIGTKQPVIARLEDGEYEGHSLTMLQKIATALHRHVEISMPTTGQAVHCV